MKKTFILSLIVLLLVTAFVSAETSYCCERTTGSAWCQNAPETQCDSGFRKAPTSCEATSYCKLGTCIDSEEGTCMENTPQRVCEENTGVWYDEDSDEIPQCDLGCCIIGDQAAFVTQTRCKRISALYGLNTSFRTDLSSEVQCIASVTSEVKGACVFEKDFEKTCLFETKKKCSEISDSSFYEGTLCSDETLGTNCGQSKKTTCVEGRDEVYFVDTCGNIANIYDASKIDNKEYWSEVKDKSEVCAPDVTGNIDSKTCGNCDYYLGSTCRAYSSGNQKPSYGDNICKDLSCKYEGKTYDHGETWCASSKGVKDNLPGSRYFRLICYDGEVTVEPCADFRQEICLESDIDGFRTAACRVNQWQDCTSQSDKKDCENEDRRDCKWIEEKCLPKYSPGFDFWEGGDSESICSTGNAQCTVVFEKKLAGGKKCVQNCECLLSSWTSKMNNICISLGDCGSQKNYLGYAGYHDEKAAYAGAGEDEE